MSLFGLILLILFVWFVLRPVVRFFMTVSRLQREARRAANRDPHDAPKAHERKAGWTAPASYRKKIDRNIGEYIEYEEITTISAPSTPNDGGDKGNYIHTESQIVDAEWEDIK